MEEILENVGGEERVKRAIELSWEVERAAAYQKERAIKKGAPVHGRTRLPGLSGREHLPPQQKKARVSAPLWYEEELRKACVDGVNCFIYNNHGLQSVQYVSSFI